METWKLSGGGPARANTTINETMGYNTVGEGVNGTRTNTATWNFRGGGYEDNQLRVRGGYTHQSIEGTRRVHPSYMQQSINARDGQSINTRDGT